MAGNTRGKLKEHFEGIHRNFDWSLHHINTALALITVQIQETQEASGTPVDEAVVKALVEKHPLYVGITALGTGIQTLDDLAQGIYAVL
jgi:hypothetical protein